MDAPAVMTIAGVAIAVVVIAIYLVIICMILKRVTDRLVVILGAVGETTRQSEPVGAVLTDINRDLEHGRAAIEACVQRLEQRFGAPNGGGEHPLAAGAKRPIVRTGYSAAAAAAEETITSRANARRGEPTEPDVSEGAVSSPAEAQDAGVREMGEQAPGGTDRGERSEGGGMRRWWNR
jgi:hypothetical protein